MPFLTHKKHFSWAFIFFFLIALAPFTAEAGSNKSQSAETLYLKAKRGYYQLKNSKKKRAYRHHWISTVNRFIDVYEKYPSSLQAYNALFTTGRLYHQLYKVSRKTQDRDKALNYYYKVVSEFKDGSLTDDALFHQGEIFLEKKNHEAALSSFKRIVQKFPKGDQAAKAKKRIHTTAPLVKSLRVAQTRPVARPVAAKDVPVRLSKVSHTVNSGVTRIVVKIEGPAKISQNRLSNPDRVYFNFLNTQLNDSIDQDIEVNGGALNRMRLSQFDATTSRLVLDIPENQNIQIATSQKGSEFFIDLVNPTAKKTAKVKVAPVKPAKAMVAAVVPAAPKPRRQAKHNVPVIVVDPGHGGKDYGAKSARNLYEKDVNLEISKRLKKILETRYGYKVIITRDDDTFIPLERRGEIANENHADLFVSIHANAAKRHSAHGIETYYLGVANSEQAQETAARENGELVQSVKDDQVQQILASLISTTKMNDSALLAGHVQEHLHSSMSRKYSGVKDLGVKEGPFFVLHDTNMPSILVEVGFVTNPREERRLKQPKYWDQLASSIARGIHEFKKDRGPTI